MDLILRQRILEEVAPNGILNFAINLGNPILAQQIGGQPVGVSVALAKEIAAELDVELKFNIFDSAGKVFAALNQDIWSIAFLAIERVRSQELNFTKPYVFLEGTYLVDTDSSYQSTAELDQSDIRISVGKGAAYDLYLSRTLSQANLYRSETSALAVEDFIFKKEKLNAAAGIRSYLDEVAKKHSEYRVIGDSFSQICQAIATPKKNKNTALFLDEFLEKKKAEGFIHDALVASGQSSILAAP